MLKQAMEHATGGDAVLRSARQQPQKRSGWMEKKAPKKRGASWSRRYFEVDAPGHLRYYKSEDTSNEPAGDLDLRLALGIKLHKHHSDNSQDFQRIDVSMADRTFKLRCASSDETQDWLDALIEWRDFALDNGAIRPSTDNLDEDAIAEEDEGDADFGNETSHLSPTDAGDTEMIASKKSKKRDVKPRNSILGSLSQQPEELQGYLSKKATGTKHWAQSWQERYFKIDAASAKLKYFKSEKDTTPKGEIDMRIVREVKLHVGSKDHGEVKDPSRFDIDCGDKTIRMKAPSAEQAQKWIDGLNEWQEYLLLNMKSDDILMNPSDGPIGMV